MWLFLMVTASEATPVANTFSYNTGRIDEICGPHNGRKLYLELGERGVLKASNVSARAPIPGTAVVSSHSQCSLEIVTCPSCVITISFKHLNLSTCNQDLSCRCDYVWVTEPPYESSGTPFCGVTNDGTTGSPGYRSQTRIVNIALLFSGSHKNAFTLEYHAERNRQVLGVTPSLNFPKSVSEFNNSGSRGGVLSSPFFPSSYPRDLGAEYVITLMDPRARVQILFSDFQLATSSIMEFYDWNGQRIDVTSGTSFRPAAIVSTGPSLLIRFYANGGAGLGYRATYTFTTDSTNDPNLRPITDCGGFVENPGGAITMMHMAEEGVKHFDCIWIVKPPRNYFHLKTHLYLKIAQFSDFGGNTELVVRQGTTSQGVALDTLRSPVSEVLGASRGQKELVIPVDVGFYIALRGAFSPRSKLAVVYAAFSYMDCFAGADLLCKNHRCISSRLSCDGFDHCGDGSDEPAATCFQDWSESSSVDRKWYGNTPNYFFPKMERYPDLKTATLVFLVSSLGLILLIVALIVLLYRMGARARQQRELQNRLQTISELLDGARIDEIVPDEPPTYEAPPDYEEVIKVGSSQPPASMSGAGPSAGPSVMGVVGVHGGLGKRRGKGRGPKQERRRAKSSPGVCINAASSREVALRVALPLSPPPHSASQRTSWSDTQGGSAPILLLARTLPEVPATPVPDSPPPPYATDSTLTGSLSQDPLLTAGSATNISTAAIEHQSNYLQQRNDGDILRTFEDSFTRILSDSDNNNDSTVDMQTRASNIRTDNSVSCELNGTVSEEDTRNELASPSSTLGSISDDLQPFPSKVCKLASVERFDDIGLSCDSVQRINLTNGNDIPSTSYDRVDVTENFANFDEIGQYPSCGSSKENSSTSQPLNRCESSPNCLTQFGSSISTADLQPYTQQELLTRSEPRSRSYEMLQNTISSTNFSDVNKLIVEPQFDENSKLLHNSQQRSTDNPNSNFDIQIQLLKAQILEQNTKLIELKNSNSHKNVSSVEGEIERRSFNMSESERARSSVSDSLLFESATYSDSCSETSCENTTNAFF